MHKEIKIQGAIDDGNRQEIKWWKRRVVASIGRIEVYLNSLQMFMVEC